MFLNFFFMRNNATPHFVGIGHGGRYLLEYFKNAGLEGPFSAIFYPHHFSGNAELPAGIEGIPFYPPAQQITRKDGKEVFRSPDWDQIPEISPEIKTVFRKSGHYVLLADFGDYTGVRLTEALLSWLDKEGFSFRGLLLYPGVFNCSPVPEVAAAVRERLGAFAQMEWVDARAGVNGRMLMVDFVERAQAEVLRAYEPRPRPLCEGEG